MRAVINNQICLASCVLAFFALFGSLEASASLCKPIIPDDGQPAPATAVSVCEGGAPLDHDLSGMTPKYPSGGQFSATKNFEIRSCGSWTCHRAARFNIRGERVTLKDESGNSNITLDVSIKQVNTNKIVTFPNTNKCTTGICQFQGAGITYKPCDECLNFELTITADLNKLIENGDLSQSGKHSGTLIFTVDQADNTEDSTAGDAGVDWRVNLDIELHIPSLIRISGLRDMTLDSTSRSGTRKFCVFALGAEKFWLWPDSSQGLVSSQSQREKEFQLRNGNELIRYEMTLSDGTQTKTISNSDWYGNWKPSNSFNCEDYNNENMEVTIQADPGGSDGMYSDTMTLYVEPYP